MIPDRNPGMTPGQQGSNEQGNHRERHILDLIDEEVAQITDADIEDRLRDTLRSAASGPRPHEGVGADLSWIYAVPDAASHYEVPSIFGVNVDLAAEEWKAPPQAQDGILAARRKAARISSPRPAKRQTEPATKPTGRSAKPRR